MFFICCHYIVYINKVTAGYQLWYYLYKFPLAWCNRNWGGSAFIG